MEAYEEMIRETATEDSPWYVVPAENKWFTRVMVAAAVIDALSSLDLSYPKVSEAKRKELAEARKLLIAKNELRRRGAMTAGSRAAGPGSCRPRVGCEVIGPPGFARTWWRA